MPTAQTLAFLFNMNLDKLIQEINAYPNTADLWSCPAGISNSAGNLAVHLLGNLNHFIGQGIGGNGYQRDRNREFTVKDVPRTELIGEIESCKTMIAETLGQLDREAMEASFSMEFNGAHHPVETIMFYMLGHLNYHLGQINYLRRIQENS